MPKKVKSGEEETVKEKTLLERSVQNNIKVKKSNRGRQVWR